MPARHRRVAQPSYLRREPPHVAGQLLQLVHCGNHSFPRPVAHGFQTGVGAADSQAASNIGIPRVRVHNLLGFNATRRGCIPVAVGRVTGRSALRGAIAASYYKYYATPPCPWQGVICSTSLGPAANQGSLLGWQLASAGKT